MKVHLETQGYLKKDAKVLDVKADAIFSTETYLNAPSKAFGGDEKIVLKGQKILNQNRLKPRVLKIIHQPKLQLKMFMHRDLQDLYCQNIDFQQKQSGNMLLQLM
jgi:hypothetical protein